MFLAKSSKLPIGIPPLKKVGFANYETSTSLARDVLLNDGLKHLRLLLGAAFFGRRKNFLHPKYERLNEVTSEPMHINIHYGSIINS